MKAVARTIALLIATTFALSALAQERPLPAGIIKSDGTISFGSGLPNLGKRLSGKTTLTPDALQIQGPGSTGPVDGMSATATGATASRTLSQIAAFASGNTATIATLKALATGPLQSGVVVAVSGYYTASDDGGGMFAWAPSSTASDDGGAVIRPTAIASGSPGRWIRQFPGGRRAVRYWGATCDGTGTGDQTGFTAAVASLSSATSNAGGQIDLPQGTCKFTATLTFPTAEPFGVASITFKGSGQHNTILDFSGAPAGSDGIFVGDRTGVKLRDFKVVGAPRDNIVIYSSKHTEAIGIRSQGAGRDGVRVTDCYMIKLDDIWSTSNAGNGFTIGITGGSGPASGYNTSIAGRLLYAQNNSVDGFVLNNLSYSHFETSGADQNRYGWNISNIGGVSLSGVGAEINFFEGFYIAGSAGTSVGALTPGVKGLTITSPFLLKNTTGTSSGNNFALISSFDSVPVQVTLIGANDLQLGTGVTKSLSATGTTTKVVELNSALLGTTTYSGGAVQSKLP